MRSLLISLVCKVRMEMDPHAYKLCLVWRKSMEVKKKKKKKGELKCQKGKAYHSEFFPFSFQTRSASRNRQNESWHSTTMKNCFNFRDHLICVRYEYSVQILFQMNWLYYILKSVYLARECILEKWKSRKWIRKATILLLI